MLHTAFSHHHISAGNGRQYHKLECYAYTTVMCDDLQQEYVTDERREYQMCLCSVLNVCGESYAWNANHVRLLVWEHLRMFVYYNKLEMVVRYFAHDSPHTFNAEQTQGELDGKCTVWVHHYVPCLFLI